MSTPWHVPGSEAHQSTAQLVQLFQTGVPQGQLALPAPIRQLNLHAESIGQILLPEICSNVCFGGTKRNRLFMTGSQSLYAVYTEAIGAHIT